MTNKQFGELVKWGEGQSGTADSLKRMAELTDKELLEMHGKGLTPELAQQWADFYGEVARLNPENPSAKGRRELMQSIVERMKNLGLGGC